MKRYASETSESSEEPVEMRDKLERLKARRNEWSIMAEKLLARISTLESHAATSLNTVSKALSRVNENAWYITVKRKRGHRFFSGANLNLNLNA
jgi:hypothetical protein